MERIDHVLPWSSLGSERQITVFRFGAGERKAYIQASLHADELPGMRCAWELKKRLTELEAQGFLNGVIELVPVANPLGLGQLLQGNHQGRFECGSGKNFNRDFVELSEPVAAKLAGRLGDDPHANIRMIRQAMLEVLTGLPAATTQLQGMQRVLLSHACNADIVLDLHCDAEAALHMYALPQHWPKWRSLAGHLNMRVGLLAEDSGGSSFDEACSLPWLRLQRQFGDAQIPLACMATTLELGGQSDTGRAEAQAYAEGILAFLAEQGLITGEWPSAQHEPCEGMPFEGTELLFAPHPGVVSFLRPAGAWVEAGEPVFEVIDPLSDRVSTVCAGTAGVLFAVERLRYAQPGFWLAKVAGREPLRHGRLLND
ncbi:MULTISPECIES: succinylglutamate desuccinylase/aspartoacylase family protein [Pseudomonas]|uniref:Succinylglutamate desuccinylase/aspartoacylase family protein n=1 Tax=Pseudomonas saxonica TaxID=2600598 RepID=A0A5C5PXP8_9PSED|nr:MULTISPECIES: succinylglutamate desuccinylase/aspartoacylase family protein [Pseudomonas]MCH4873991.1 succinylglutamate desuccinylase/aspartoacylase family protein [Pseudomonas sp. TMW22091]TWR89862.1 succinylglutamate desuccinylase/aspartoacylase family protein [Pseudomonas saxonica]TWR94290.1 succinylglutamate desuccinylase/aspartoacylase family protein [Pseudomonas saxonica]WRQ75807.1 succinylglutamate desuccinylase/aspartoacylase family protein [Pseudomonas saxonica]